MVSFYQEAPDCRFCAIKCKDECAFEYPSTPQGETLMLCRNYPEARVGSQCGHPEADLCPSRSAMSPTGWIRPCPHLVVITYRYVKPNWLCKNWQPSDGYRLGYYDVRFARRRLRD